MKEDIRLIEIQLPQDSEIIKALIASRNKEENIDSVEIFLYMGKGKRPLKIILRPKDESLDFDVTTPYDTRGKVCTCIGKAQFAKAIPIGIPINSANLTDLYSLSIEIVEQPTNFAESFIERIKVLKDELGVAKETLRLTGDIFHILPHAKKRFNIVKNKEEAIQTPKEAPFSSKSEEKSSECICCKNNELSELFERMREFLNKLPITQIESLSQVDIDTKNGNKPSGYTSELKTIYPNPIPSPVNKIEDYEERKVFISSHILESDAVRAEKEWIIKLNKNRDSGDLLIKRGTNLINFGFIYDFKIKTDFKYATYSTKIYSIYANIKINTTGTKDYKLTEKDMQEAVICSLEKLDPKKVSAGENNPAESISTPKATETIIVPFSIALKGIVAYSHLLSYINHYKATFRFKNKEFKGEIKSINIQDSSTTTANARYTSPSSVKAIVNIAITQECKDTIDNLKKELRSEEICVGSLGFDSITKSAGALYTIKSYAEKEDRQTINIDMSLNAVVELERFSQLVNKYSNLPFVVSISNEQAARIIYCADTEEEAVNLIMKIKDKLKNRFIENKSKQSDFTIYNNYINIEIKSFSSDNTILKVQDVVLVASRDLGKYFVVAKLQ